MKRFARVLIGMGLVAVTTWGMEHTSPALAQAVTDRQVYREPVSGLYFNPCGENIALSGESQWVFQTRQDARGGFHWKGHYNFAGVTGLGELTGTRYRVVSMVNDALYADFDEFPAVYSNTHMFQFVGTGPADNVRLYGTFHFTINARGEVTSLVSRFTLKCG